MGSLMSKQSSGNTVTTRNHTSEENSFQNFTSSLRRSLRIKRRSTNASDLPRPQSQLSPSDPSKTPAPVRSKLPEIFKQQPESTTIHTPSPAAPESVNFSSISKVAPTPDQESPKIKIPPEEVGKAMNVLKEAIETKGKEAAGFVNQKAEEIGEKIEETVNTGLQQVRTFKDDVIVSGKEVKDVIDKKLKEAGEKVQTQVDEGRLEVESILSRLSPAGKSEEQSPEVEITPKPVKTSLLASLEKRKMQREERLQITQISESRFVKVRGNPKSSKASCIRKPFLMLNIIYMIENFDATIELSEAYRNSATFYITTPQYPPSFENVT
ncbi:unnamed protein product [Rodentolepis nana]|uniref:Uncharacterized protein n=1 Tax=Rodentolepis nana TaxID=102285 RepID=A0A158QIQ3_RODNA|nr:unnamed protein product [Rodentolepis nana]